MHQLSRLLAFLLFITTPQTFASNQESDACELYTGGFFKKGRHTTTTESFEEQRVTIYRPAKLRWGRKYPVIFWANGTFMPTIAYQGFLKHLASHGFIVAASHSSQPMFSPVLSKMKKWVQEQNKNKQSRLFGHINTKAIGAAGHSQGGVAVINSAERGEFKTSVLLAPGPFNVPNKLKGSSLFISAAEDTICPPERVYSLYATAPGEKVYTEVLGLHHNSFLGSNNETKAMVTAWFKSELENDKASRCLFRGPDCFLCKLDKFGRVERSNLDKI